MSKVVSAKASFNPVIGAILFGTRDNAVVTMKAIIDATENNKTSISAHGVKLTTRRPTTLPSSNGRA